MVKPSRPTFETSSKARNITNKLLNPVPVQPDLIPLGNNFYATPPTPQEPNYDDPFSDSPIGIDIEFVNDGCNIGIQLTGSLAFFKLPSFQLIWRNPACTPRKDPFKMPDVHTMPSTTDIYFRLKYQPYYASCWEEYLGDDKYFEDKGSLNIQILSITGSVDSIYIDNLGITYLWSGEVIYKAKRTVHQQLFGDPPTIWYRNRDETFSGIYKAYYASGWNRNLANNFSEVLDGDDDAGLRYLANNFIFTYSISGARKISVVDYDKKYIPLPYSSSNTYFSSKRAYGETYIDVSDGTLDLSDIPDNNYDVEYKCDVPLPLAPPPRPMKDCCYETKQIMYANQSDLLARIQNLEIKNSQLEIKNSQLEQDKLAIENYINQLDQAGKEILSSITRLNIVFDIVGIFINNLFKLLFRR
ncbi:hypothetical protein A0J48_007010 [Sphaerospermopsis aphanizomenoides BCCUSP55]|uniref:hypothetical protein n=1 Tax=Sphaerospermopsis aphanizomenoides TaxID=459663 RepID=UPI001906A437|nr:hypothetical protein [Sphaerospermopsis aphanizomenoides]MBK1987286.1 hypothetical protein [Sphaerospermopsis aphanizomenoides BCCUSP55]